MRLRTSSQSVHTFSHIVNHSQGEAGLTIEEAERRLREGVLGAIKVRVCVRMCVYVAFVSV
jgi:hypothetical protein